MKFMRKVLQIIFDTEITLLLTIVFVLILPLAKLVYLISRKKAQTQSMWHTWEHLNDELSQVQKQY